ncbi:DNA polymerase subunit Cdc27 [Podospora didyma]|uniref:DNA polymerase delta subunit 3 n=1 Tax=Podospora didyma TaxID=330526 RepID=A0AAE0P082_9PEZI|nr:DNA polymerase subunit Cdc27 [Podospora didyma]
MDDYKKFLGETVLTEEKVITYQLLSRALQVNVNVAKQMLYDFHRTQNARRVESVHATYLVYGVKKAEDGTSQSRNGINDDVDMTSSMPEVDSLGEVVPTLTLSLIQEERLRDALAEYEEVSSIHVYSVGPHPAKDLALLADVAQKALMLHGSQDTKAYATIHNPFVHQRERKDRPVAAPVKTAPIATKVAPRQEAKPSFFKTAAPAPPKPKGDVKPLAEAPSETEKATSSATAPFSKKPTPSLKRGGSSNSAGGIMQAFSKAATKKIKKETETSQPATPSGDDSSIQPLSDDGEDDSEVVPQPKSRAGQKSKSEREEALRQMMEQDDVEEEEPAETPHEDDRMDDEEPPAEPEPPKEEKAEVITTSGDGRRRGKRKIMKKKQIMDDQGYLVTIQEPGWESFSEDEPAPPPPPKAKAASSGHSGPALASKGKKNAPKGSQGSIMSFFSKK